MPLSTIDNTGLSQSQIITAVNMPTGSVIQVVSATQSSQVSTASTSFVTTGLTASITPQFSTSKILAIHSDSGSRTGASGNGLIVTLYRNGSNVTSSGTSPYWLNYIQSNAAIVVGNCSFTYLDSPASTSSITYTVYVASYNTASTVIYNTGTGLNTLVLMEIR